MADVRNEAADETSLSTVMTVHPGDSASNWGNDGLEVLSTPAILGHMENACVKLLTPGLAEGEMTVGTSVRMRHLRPVKVGEQVNITVHLTEPGRKMGLTFEITDAEGRLVSDGWHGRAVVQTSAFLRSINES